MNTTQAFVVAIKTWNVATKSYLEYFAVRQVRVEKGQGGIELLNFKSLRIDAQGDEVHFTDLDKAHLACRRYNEIEDGDSSIVGAKWDPVYGDWEYQYETRSGSYDSDREDFHADL